MPTIFDIRRFSVHDGPGIRTSVFFKGCNLVCPWCHNPESRSANIECVSRYNILEGKSFEVKEFIGKELSTEAIMQEIRRDLPFYEESGGGVTFSGGEPLLQASALMELLQACKKEAIHTAVDTSGAASPLLFQEIAMLTDLFLFDIKLSDNQEHIKYCGLPNIDILANLRLLTQLNKDVIIRIPLIPSINSSEDNLNGTLAILKECRSVIQRVDLLPYHRLSVHKYEALNQTHNDFGDLDLIILDHWQKTLESNGFCNIVGG